MSAELEGMRAIVLHLDQRCDLLPSFQPGGGGDWFFPCHVFMDRGSGVEFPFVRCGYESVLHVKVITTFFYVNMCCNLPRTCCQC